MVGGVFIISGAVFTSIKRPKKKSQPVELNQVSVVPTKGGMFASVGFDF